MASSDDLISFQAFVATSSKASTVSDTSVDCVLFDFMIRVCDFYLIGVRRTDKLHVVPSPGFIRLYHQARPQNSLARNPKLLWDMVPCS